MIIRLVIIPVDDLSRVLPSVEALRSAVNAGNMDGVDTATGKLVALTAEDRSIDLSEEEWQGFLAKIRAANPAFQANYLLPGEVYSSLLPSVTSETMVLSIPLDEKDTDHV